MAPILLTRRILTYLDGMPWMKPFSEMQEFLGSSATALGQVEYTYYSAGLFDHLLMLFVDLWADLIGELLVSRVDIKPKVSIIFDNPCSYGVTPSQHHTQEKIKFSNNLSSKN